MKQKNHRRKKWWNERQAKQIQILHNMRTWVKNKTTDIFKQQYKANFSDCLKSKMFLFRNVNAFYLFFIVAKQLCNVDPEQCRIKVVGTLQFGFQS